MRLTHARRPLFFTGLLLAVCLLTGCGVGKVVIGDGTHDTGGAPSGTTSSGTASSGTTSSGTASSSTTSSSSGSTDCSDGMTVVASSTSIILQIAVGGDRVFWLDADGLVRAAAVCGGAPITLATGPANPQQLTVDTAHVYWTAGDSVLKVPIGGGPTTTIASGQTYPSAIGVDQSRVYWLGSGILSAAPLDGGPVTVLATTSVAAGIGPSLAVAVDATYAYWTNGDVGDVWKIPLAGSGPPSIVVSGQGPVSGLAVDATSIYWTTAYSDTGTVMRAPLDGGAITTLADHQLGPYAVRVDGSSAYWTAGQVQNTLMRIAVDGGPVTTLATATSVPSPSIAVDATSVYWNITSGSAFQIMRVTPK
jgi:sugar lactone lactonase YvrE